MKACLNRSLTLNRSFLQLSLPLLALTISLISCFAIKAQTPEQIADITKSLSPQSQLVLKRLAELNIFPTPDWTVHVGDLPHGEAMSLDHSAWQPLTPTFEVPADQPAWFRAEVAIPQRLNGYDLSGARIWFQFRFSGDGTLTATIYFDGRRVALGESLEPIVLFENAKPGDKMQVTVKLPRAARTKRFRGSPMRIEPAATRPSPGSLWEEFISASAFILNSPVDATRERTQLEHAITSVNLSALDKGEQNDFDTSLRAAQSELEALKPSLQKFKFLVVGNSHIDSAWLWPWTETVEAVRRTFGTAAQLMQEYPEYTFSQSAAAHSEWIVEKYPDINEEIKKRIKEGRWEIVGGMWVEPDLNMPDGESLVRQLLVGQRYFQQQYGVAARIGWNPDSFGYNWQLPQIYKRSGIDYFITAKLWTNETHKLPFNLFWWQSPDGSKVLTYLPHKYDNTNLSVARISADLASTQTAAPGLTTMMDMYGIGDHGGGPTRILLDEGLRWAKPNNVTPLMRFGTAMSFFDSVTPTIDPTSTVWNYRSMNEYKLPTPPEAGRARIPTWNDELYYEFHRGVLTTQANHKRNMREGEERVLNAEKYSSLAWLAGDAYPASEITESWKKVLFNQFHDLGAGSGIGVIYKEAQKDYDDVRWATNEISTKALTSIASGVNTRATGEVPILVFNPLAWNRSGPVTVDVQMPAAAGRTVTVLDSHDQIVPAKVLTFDEKRNNYRLLLDVKDVPSMGYKLLHVIPGAKTFVSDLRVNGFTLENAALRVTVDSKTGFITSLYDKKANYETLAAGGQGNQLQTFADNPKCCDAWNIDPGTLGKINVIDQTDSVELVENNPLQATIRVTRTWQKSKFVQDITLYAGGDQVEVSNEIDWHETHTLLKVAFPLAASSNFATYEIPYGTIERPTTRNNSWEETRFEVAALRWADLGDGKHGFSLINETKYGYDAKGNVLRLSLLRSPTSPDPLADQGHHHFTYSLYPHAGDWKQALSERKGYEYNYRLTAMQVMPHSGSLPVEYSYVSVSPENVVLTALKKAEDANGLLLRLVEWAGKDTTVKIKVPPGATSATLTNLMEKPEGQALRVVDGFVSVKIHPYEILSLRVDYPHP